MSAVLIDDDRVEIPEGFCVVTRGKIRPDDEVYCPELQLWRHLDASDLDDQYNALGEDVKDFFCVIRRDLKETP